MRIRNLLFALLLIAALVPGLARADDLPLTWSGCTDADGNARVTLTTSAPLAGTLYSSFGAGPAGNFAEAGDYAWLTSFPDDGQIRFEYVSESGQVSAFTLVYLEPLCEAAPTDGVATIELTVPGPGWYQWGGWDAFGTAFDTGLRTQAEPTDDGAGWRVRLTLGEQGSRDPADWFVTAASP